MSITIKKARKAAPPVVAAVEILNTEVTNTQVDLAKAADRFAVADREYKLLKVMMEPLEKDRAEAQQEFLLIYEDLFDDATKRIVQGEEHQVEVSAPKKTRKIMKGGMIAIRQMMDKIEKGLFSKVATVTLANVDKYLTDDQKAEIIEDGKGARTVKSL